MRSAAPFGSWPTPFTADSLTEASLRLGELTVGDGRLWWVEGRPAEAGRQVLVSADPAGLVADHTPDDVSVRTTVHEYGGGSFTVTPRRGTVGPEPPDGGVVFSAFADQRLWSSAPGQEPHPLTPPPPQPGAWRYADGRVIPGSDWLVCVRERHHGPATDQVENDLALVHLSGEREAVTLVGGHDFFAAPRPSVDGSRLAWLSWDHPNMPWDGTELWVADLVAEPGCDRPAISGVRRVAGGPDESVSQPRWGREGRLYWVSDRTGWWNLYVDDGGPGHPLAPRAAEFSRPDWVFGQSTYAFLTDGRLVATWSAGGIDHIGIVDPACDRVREIPTRFTRFTAVAALGDDAVAIAASSTEAAAVVVIPLDDESGPDDPRVRVVRRSRDAPFEPAWVSVPVPITFPTTGERTAHAFWYPPTNPDHEGLPGTQPPLVVLSHGGPTSSASPALDVAVQFWTSRGLAVVDVDYGGSSGYGRSYRRVLDGAWGEVDVDDCVAAARYLAGEGKVDPARMVIRGSSAGGFTTLCALTFRDVFAAGASLYGVADLAALAADTHKFESRYLDRLVGPLPEAAELYRRRSPLHHPEGLSCPVIVLQGLEDQVVPPVQAEVLVGALRAKGLPVAYVTFAGEQHGFRRSETIRAAAEAELSFYGQVLGFEPAGPVAPLTVENLSRLSG